jgi:hypothetical protein
MVHAMIAAMTFRERTELVFKNGVLGVMLLRVRHLYSWMPGTATQAVRAIALLYSVRFTSVASISFVGTLAV